MKLKYLLCIFLILIPGGISFSQERSVSNLSLIDALIEQSFTGLGNKMLISGMDKFYNVVTGRGETDEYLLSAVRRNFNGYKLIINEDSDSIDYKLTFTKPEFKVIYKDIHTDNILGTKRVRREVSVTYGIELTDKRDGARVFNEQFNKKITEDFDLDRISSAEDVRYKFSRGQLPEESTLNQILIPSAIITVSAAAIILFFIIRSK